MAYCTGRVCSRTDGPKCSSRQRRRCMCGVFLCSCALSWYAGKHDQFTRGFCLTCGLLQYHWTLQRAPYGRYWSFIADMRFFSDRLLLCIPCTIITSCPRVTLVFKNQLILSELPKLQLRSIMNDLYKNCLLHSTTTIWFFVITKHIIKTAAKPTCNFGSYERSHSEKQALNVPLQFWESSKENQENVLHGLMNRTRCLCRYVSGSDRWAEDFNEVASRVASLLFSEVILYDVPYLYVISEQFHPYRMALCIVRKEVKRRNDKEIITVLSNSSSAFVLGPSPQLIPTLNKELVLITFML